MLCLQSASQTVPEEKDGLTVRTVRNASSMDKYIFSMASSAFCEKVLLLVIVVESVY